MSRLHEDASAVLSRIRRAPQYGYLSKHDLAWLAREHRLHPVLIRFQEGRCTTPAQNAVALIEVAEAGGWHVRDVSLLASGGAS